MDSIGTQDINEPNLRKACPFINSRDARMQAPAAGGEIPGGELQQQALALISQIGAAPTGLLGI